MHGCHKPSSDEFRCCSAIPESLTLTQSAHPAEPEPEPVPTAADPQPLATGRRRAIKRVAKDCNKEIDDDEKHSRALSPDSDSSVDFIAKKDAHAAEESTTDSPSPTGSEREAQADEPASPHPRESSGTHKARQPALESATRPVLAEIAEAYSALYVACAAVLCAFAAACSHLIPDLALLTRRLQGPDAERCGPGTAPDLVHASRGHSLARRRAR